MGETKCIEIVIKIFFKAGSRCGLVLVCIWCRVYNTLPTGPGDKADNSCNFMRVLNLKKTLNDICKLCVISVGDRCPWFCPDCCHLLPPFVIEENAHFQQKCGEVKGQPFSIQIHRLLEFYPQEPQGPCPQTAETKGISQVTSSVTLSSKTRRRQLR